MTQGDPVLIPGRHGGGRSSHPLADLPWSLGRRGPDCGVGLQEPLLHPRQRGRVQRGRVRRHVPGPELYFIVSPAQYLNTKSICQQE